MNTQSTDPAPIDDPRLEEAVDTAWSRLLAKFPTLELLGPSGGATKARLSEAARDAAAKGLKSVDELADAALASMPKLRNPNRDVR